MEQSVTKRMAKNFSWLLVGNIASGLLNFFTIIYLARVLGAAAFGLLQFAQAFLLYLVVVVDSGLSTYGTREIARDRSRAGEVSINIFSLRLLSALLIFCLSVFVIVLMPVDATLRLLFIITFLLVFYRALNADWVFQGLEKMQYVAAAKLIFSALTFCFIVLLVKRPADLVNVPMTQFIFGLLIALSVLLLLFKKILPFDPTKISFRSWPKVFWVAVPLGVSTIFMQLYDNLDTIMLGIMDKPAIVGVYNAAYRIFYIFAGVFSLWLATVLPVVCKRMTEDKVKTKFFLEKIIRLTLLLTMPVTVGVCLAAPLFIRVFFGSGYAGASTALRYLIWALIPLAISNIYGSLILIPAGFFSQFMISVAAGAATNIFFNIILIPNFSYIGAALATIIAQSVAGVFALYFSRKAVRLDLLKYLIKPLIISMVAFVFFFLTYFLLPMWGETPRFIISNLVFIVIAGLLLIRLEYDFIAEFTREILRK